LIIINRNQIEKIKRLSKEGGVIVLGQIIAVIGSLVLVKVLTKYISPIEYGELSLALTLGTLICQVSMSGVMPGIFRFYPIAEENEELPLFFNASKQLMIYGTIITLALGSFLLISAFFLGFQKWISITLISIIVIQLGSYNSSMSNIQNAARQRGIVAFHGGLDSWLKILLALTIMYFFGNTVKSVLLSYVLVAIIILISQFFFLKKLIPINNKNGSSYKLLMKSMWNYSKPFAIFNLFTWAQASSDRWALGYFSNTENVGFYALLLQLGYTPITMGIGLLNNFLAPILHQRSGDAMDSTRNSKVRSITNQLTMVCLIFTFVIFFCTLILHKWIFSILVGAEYQSISYLFPWILLAGGFFAAGQVVTMKVMSDMKTSSLIWPKLITSIIGVTFNFAGVFFGGLVGLVIAAISFSILHFLWLFKVSQNIKSDTILI
jgi:O-antigen/teichoic acid export membrane protein